VTGVIPNSAQLFPTLTPAQAGEGSISIAFVHQVLHE
jgi:hypothetical protein